MSKKDKRPSFPFEQYLSPRGLKPDGMLMTDFYCFPFSIMQKSLKSIYLPNIAT